MTKNIKQKQKILASILALIFPCSSFLSAQPLSDIMEQNIEQPGVRSLEDVKAQDSGLPVPYGFEDFLGGSVLASATPEDKTSEKHGKKNDSMDNAGENSFLDSLTATQRTAVEKAVEHAAARSTFYYKIAENLYESISRLDEVAAFAKQEIEQARTLNFQASIEVSIEAPEAAQTFSYESNRVSAKADAMITGMIMELAPENFSEKTESTNLLAEENAAEAEIAEDSAEVEVEKEVKVTDDVETIESTEAPAESKEENLLRIAALESPAAVGEVTGEIPADAEKLNLHKVEFELAMKKLYQVLEQMLQTAPPESSGGISEEEDKNRVDRIIQDFTELVYHAAERVREIYLPGYKTVTLRYSQEKRQNQENRAPSLIGAASPSDDKPGRAAILEHIDQYMPGIKSYRLLNDVLGDASYDEQTISDIYAFIEGHLKNHLYPDRHPYMQWLAEIAKINYSRKVAEQLIRHKRELRRLDDDERRLRILNAILAEGKAPIFLTTRMTSLREGPGIAGSSVKDRPVSKSGRA